MTADDDTLYTDMTERERQAVDALTDIEGIESDAAAGGWDDGAVENAANSAASELRDLLDAIQARRDQIPPFEEVGHDVG